MKAIGRIDFVFDTDFVVCLGDDREDGELQVSFEGSLSLQLAAEGVQSLLFLASQIQKVHSIEDKSIIETQFNSFLCFRSNITGL